MAIGLILRNAATLFSNDNRNFAFVIQFFRFRWTDQRRVCGSKAARKTWEQRHVGRGLNPVFVFGISIWEIHANANNFFWVCDGQFIVQALDCVDLTDGNRWELTEVLKPIFGVQRTST